MAIRLIIALVCTVFCLAAGACGAVDAVFAEDSDGDGIEDVYDNYPHDPNRA